MDTESSGSISATLDLSLTLMSLPVEILQLILDKVSQDDLTSCARVSVSLNRLSTPLIWQEIRTHSLENLPRFKSSETQQALIRNARHVRELCIDDSDVFDMFRAGEVIEPKLERSHTFRTLRRPERQRDIVTIIQQNPFLVELRVFDYLTAESALAIVHSLQMMRVLDLSVTMTPQMTKYLLENLPESIQEVALEQLHSTVDDSDIVANLPTRSESIPKHHHALESLHLSGDLQAQIEYVLLPFLTTCNSNLKDFRGPSLKCFCIQSIHDVLSQLGVYLNEISGHSAGARILSDDEFAEVIHHSPRLKRIDLQHLRHAGPMTAAAIQTRCEHLEELNVSNCSWISSRYMQQILELAPRLKVLEAMRSADEQHRTTPVLAAISILATEEWATLSLESLVCQIEVPRPDTHVAPTKRKEGLASPTIEHSRDMQRQVLRRLARQTKLREFQLGPNCEDEGALDPRFHWYSLELSLDSGLEELVALKEIKVLSVSLTNHRVGIRELEWMVENWPRLETVHGLVRDASSESEQEVMVWLDANRPTWS
ncbi:hypothetical protein BG003_009696 [Podila horticola]|nr:hypothetical protein BG003_009696 [Podila horticola]